NYNEPSIGKLTIKLLRHVGYEVIVPPQRESGMPAIEYGMLDEARKLAEYNLKQLKPFAQNGCRIVCSSPAATFLLKSGYATILDEKFLDISDSVLTLLNCYLK